MRNLILSLLLTCCFFCIFAEDNTNTLNRMFDKGRGIESSWSLQIGNEQVADTYLSVETFSGTSLGIAGAWEKMLRSNPEKIGMRFDAEVGGGTLYNQAGTKRMIDFGAEVGWTLFRRWMWQDIWKLRLGGRVGLEGGLLYIATNGNNPVSARAVADVSLSAGVERKLKIGRTGILISDHLEVPMIGLFFSPQYGESYYEIYLGNHSGLVHFANPASRPGVRNRLSVGLPVGRILIEAGYRFDYISQRACNLRSTILTHSFTVGVSF